MNKISLHGKVFDSSIKEDEIVVAVKGIAERMNNELKGLNPLFIVVLNGAFMFAADLLKNITIDCEISFAKLSSYEGTSTTGNIKELIGLNEALKDRCVVVVEDIVDTGITIETIVAQLKQQKPKQIKIATLLLKPDVYKKNIVIDYVAFKVQNHFLVGYGLDYNGLGRNLKQIYKLEN